MRWKNNKVEIELCGIWLQMATVLWEDVSISLVCCISFDCPGSFPWRGMLAGSVWDEEVPTKKARTLQLCWADVVKTAQAKEEVWECSRGALWLLARVLLDEVARIYLILSHAPSNILGCTRFKFPEKFIFDMRYKVRHRSGTASITWQWWSNGSTVCFRRDFVKVEKKSYQKAEQLMVLVWVLFESFVLKQDV